MASSTKQSPIVKMALIGIGILGIMFSFSYVSKVSNVIDELPVEGANDVKMVAPPVKTSQKKDLLYKSLVPANIANKDSKVSGDPEAIKQDVIFWDETTKSGKSPSNLNGIPPIPAGFKSEDGQLLPPPLVTGNLDPKKIEVYDPKLDFTFENIADRTNVSSISSNGAIINNQFIYLGDTIESVMYETTSNHSKYDYPVLTEVNMDKEFVVISTLDRKRSKKVRLS